MKPIYKVTYGRIAPRFYEKLCHGGKIGSPT